MEERVNSKKLASIIAMILDDKLAQNIQILNISNVSVLSDYFVICSGTSTTQVRAMTNEVRVQIKEHFGILPAGLENDTKGRWNLLDYGDVVVHIMHYEQRENYALEKFWNHAFKLERDVWEEESKDFAKFKK